MTCTKTGCTIQHDHATRNYYVCRDGVYPCYDCGSTIPGHHTPHCEMAEVDAIRDLEETPNTQYWSLPRDQRPMVPVTVTGRQERAGVR